MLPLTQKIVNYENRAIIALVVPTGKEWLQKIRTWRYVESEVGSSCGLVPSSIDDSIVYHRKIDFWCRNYVNVGHGTLILPPLLKNSCKAKALGCRGNQS